MNESTWTRISELKKEFQMEKTDISPLKKHMFKKKKVILV